MTVIATFMTYNEAHVLPRMLASVAEHVDGAVVIDGGSTDRSVPLVREAFGDDLHLTVLDKPYMVKRNALMREARGRGDHLLLVDPDHELRVRSPLPASLDQPVYTLTEWQGTWVWPMPRLVSGERLWCYKGGPIHEYLDVPSAAPLEAWELIHHADSRPVDAKLAINLEQLQVQLRDDPDDARSQFYLANTYLDLRRFTDAIAAYDRRLRMAGYDEEIFISMLNKGKCQLMLGEVGEARWTFRWCGERWPHRAEPWEYMRLTLPLGVGLFVESQLYGPRPLPSPPEQPPAV